MRPLLPPAGCALLVLPIVLRPSRWGDGDFRRTYLGSVLIFSVIFNHKAEQPSFMIAANSAFSVRKTRISPP